MILAKNVSFHFTGKPLYEEASFSVPKNKKAGLVGLNGAGKSTLFKLILGEEYPDDGKVKVEGSVRLVPQEVSYDKAQYEAKSVREYLKKAKPHKDHFYENLMSKMEMKSVSLDDVPQKLSGGQRTKLALMFAVLAEPDVLLLDEPTNFMDTAGKKWVMHWLSGYKKTLLVVSHDLELLDRHIDKVVYINKQTKKFEEYTGTYSKFKKLKAEKDAHLTRYIRNQQQKVKRMKKSVERLKRSNVEKVIRQRVVMERRIARIEDSLPELPEEVVRIKLQLPTPAHVGSVPVIVRDLKKAFGGKEVLGSVSFSVQKGQRIALIGHNGAGKSTLIKAILGKIEVDDGEVILDKNISVGYYSQEFESFDLSMNLYDTVRKNSFGTEGQIRSFLAKFMFGNDKLKQSVESLSGGEKTRLSIALLMLKEHNLLVLDEPTTYLDVLSQKIILEALKEYQGAMLVVSHTGDFLRGLKPEKALLLPEERFVYWEDSLVERAVEI